MDMLTTHNFTYPFARTAALIKREECVSDVRAWLVSHKLMFKDSKTEFLVIGTPQQLSKIEIGPVNVGGIEIKSVDSVRNLR
jgi:hypothetical protein